MVHLQGKLKEKPQDEANCITLSSLSAASKMAVPMNYDYFLSDLAKRRKPSPIRVLEPLRRIEGMISLGAGIPAAQLFPFESISVKLRDGETLKVDGHLLGEALQYLPSAGMGELIPEIKALTKRQHSPPFKNDLDWGVIITTGSQDAITKAFEMLLNEGDSVLLEDPTYGGILAALRPMNVNLIPISMDEEGMSSNQLESTLTNWAQLYPNLRPPKVLYIYFVARIPTGQNPSGLTASPQRRLKIYEICSRFNILILEDDAYWNLQLVKEDGSYLVPNLKSFFSMDKDHRVLRFDSFSKVVSSGFRIGWMSGPKFLVDRLELNMQATELHTSGVSQAIVYSLLRHWGPEGFDKHVKAVQAHYSRQARTLLALAEKYLTGLCEWRAPGAGMFVWFKCVGISDTKALILEKAINAKVLMVPGYAFSVDPEAPSSYVRASFSTASPELMEEALKRLAQLLRSEQVIASSAAK